jgi:adenine-specific DNA-methyltransferase
MNSLLEKEGQAGKVQMVYIDPPYGIRYGSNFQPFVNRRDVHDGCDEDLTQEPETIQAFRDTWELGIHSYLTYLRDRMLLARDLLHESGSCFVQIGDENLHLVRNLMDEMFGEKNFCASIVFAKTSGQADRLLASVGDHLLWYAKDRATVKFHALYRQKIPGESGASRYTGVELANGTRRTITPSEAQDPTILPAGSRVFTTEQATAQEYRPDTSKPFELGGRVFSTGGNLHWKPSLSGMERLAKAKRLVIEGNLVRYVRYLDDFPVNPFTDYWPDIGGIQSRSDPKVYAVQTSTTAVARCLLMTTDPSDLVVDPTCGSGTTAYVAEHRGRRWITCDTSRVAITLAKQRLMTATFEYYELAHPEQGVRSGFVYKTVPHVSLKSIANGEPPEQEPLYDRPRSDRSKMRVTGPFTVEAVPSPVVRPLDGDPEPPASDGRSPARARRCARPSGAQSC